jgi:DNA primase small subunit
MEIDHQGMPEKVKPAPITGAGSFELDFNVDLLKIYYDKAFPYDLMYKWLSYFKFRNAANSHGQLQSLKDNEDCKSE